MVKEKMNGDSTMQYAASLMRRQLYKIAAIMVVAFSLILGFAAPVAAGSAGDAKNEVCQGVNLGGGTCNANSADLTNVIGVIVNVLSIIAGVAAVIMLILGGLKYVTSGGDSSSTASAKNTIIYAIVGLIVVALAQAIVRFVLGRSTTG